MKKIRGFLAAAFFLCLTMGIYSCGGKDKTPPVLTLYEHSTGYTEEEITILVATAADDKDGTVPVSYVVISPSGKEVGVSGGKFVPHEAGVYRVVFTAKDKSGNRAEEETEIVVRDRNSAPVLTIGEYETETSEGSVYTLPECTASDAEGELSVTVKITAPDGSDVQAGAGNAFFVDWAGLYSVRFGAARSDGVESHKLIYIASSGAEKVVEGVDGEISDALYAQASAASLGGSRGLEGIGVKIARGSDGIFLAFDGSDDKRVSGEERLEIYLDTKGTARYPDENTTVRFDAYLSGKLVLMRGTGGESLWREEKLSKLSYSRRPAFAVRLKEGSTIESGNEDDKGYTAELYIPYKLLKISAADSFYLTMGCVREGDKSDWDGWNEFALFPEPIYPFKYIEVKPDGYLFNDNRLYHDAKRADGDISKAKYHSDSTAVTEVGGLRGLEGMTVRIARDSDGLYLGFDVSGDKKVNDFDRVEVAFNVGEYHAVLNENNNVVFFLQSNGALQVLHGHNGVYREFFPYDALPAAGYSYGRHTTPNDNTDEDDGYFLELYIPYALFNKYTVGGVGEDTRLGITFGLWRASAEYNTTSDWGTDPNKDWDGWSYGEFCDPLYPETYAVLMSDGRIMTRDALVDEIGAPSDPSVDGKLTEAYWKKAAALNIPKTEDADGVKGLVYRDSEGLRVAFLGDARKLTAKDVLVFYVSTKDSAYKMGGNLGDEYEARGQYANIYDYTFRIWLDRSVAVYRGLYKDWADPVEDLRALSLAIDKECEEYSYVAEMYIPYSFFTASDGFTPSQEDVLGLSLRLGGENSRGSVVWNNYHYAGIYCDSESPASYVRIDKDNKLFAALENDGGYRVDGAFDEEVYSGAKAVLSVGGSEAEIYRSAKGLHVKYAFAEGVESFRLVLSTVDHGVGKPYVYDYQIILNRSGKVECSFGNSYAFYDTSLYVPYCAPRAVFAGDTAELFISYDYLSRYNTGSAYAPKGYMQITKESELRFAADCVKNGTRDGECVYGGESVFFDALDPASYRKLILKEAENG